MSTGTLSVPSHTALKLLEEMKERRLEVDTRVFNILIAGYAHQGDFKIAVEILRMMKQEVYKERESGRESNACLGGEYDLIVFLLGGIT